MEVSSQLRRGIEEILRRHPDFEVSHGERYGLKIVSLVGPLEIFDSEGLRIAYYEVRLDVPSDLYPNVFPFLFEVSDKIPKTADRHFMVDGSCCVVIPQELEIRSKRGITLLEYYDEYVVPFFANQKYYELTGGWIAGDWKHGIEGERQYYYELFNSNDDQEVVGFLKQFLSGKLPGNNDPCICGRAKKYKKCHMGSINMLRRIGSVKVEKDIGRLF